MTRLRAQIRRREQSEEVVFQIGPFSFLPALKLVLDAKNNIKIHLTDKEAEIITFLYLAGGSVVSRDVLLGEVWGYSAGVTTHTLETHVYRLRQKIEPDRTKPIFLMTELNGYRLVL
jgi:DNA-binding response OmpR family regulator